MSRIQKAVIELLDALNEGHESLSIIRPADPVEAHRAIVVVAQSLREQLRTCEARVRLQEKALQRQAEKLHELGQERRELLKNIAELRTSRSVPITDMM